MQREIKYIYGPILSRRLGRSLGVDPIPLKTCNWNCIYCQLGRTVPLINERKDYFPRDEILKEVRIAIEFYTPYQIDWISIAGSGEPLLCKSIGWLIQEIKAITNVPVAIITSGSLLYLPQVRKDILLADAVLPTVNAGSDFLYRQIHRPHPQITFEKYAEGLIKFREEYKGKLWPEVMLIKGLNDTEKALQDISWLLERIQPDRVHINLPVRAPAEAWVKPSDQEGLRRALAILGDRVQIVSPIDGNLLLNDYESLIDEIIGIVSRHPLSEEELIKIFPHLSPSELKRTLEKLKTNVKIQVIERYGKHFLCAASAHYPQEVYG